MILVWWMSGCQPEIIRVHVQDKSEVAGKANVLIFPDLNTGNNTYKVRVVNRFLRRQWVIMHCELPKICFEMAHSGANGFGMKNSSRRSSRARARRRWVPSCRGFACL